MIEKPNNETISELAAATPIELTENELAHIAGGIADDGSGQVGFCGTKPPGSHPGGVHHS